MRLTNQQAKNLKPHATKVLRLFDGNGLHLECRPTGSKLWILKYRFSGRERRISLGSYTKGVTLKDARQRREDAQRLLRAGLDPGEERRKAQRARQLALGTTVQQVTDEWLRDREPGWTAAYAEDSRRAFSLHLFPKLGARPIADVQAVELLDLFRRLTAGGTRRELVRRLRQKCEQVWNFAIITGRATTNVAAPLKGQLVAPEVRGFAAVAEKDLPGLLAAVRGYGNVVIECCVLLQVLTAVRPGEARGARWEEFDRAASVWTIPAGRMKRRKEHVVPLSRQALAVLDRLESYTGGNPVLFPSRSRPGAPMSDGTVSACLKRVGYGNVTPHGFRKTFSTAAHEAGHRSDIIEACLAHTDVDRVRAIYNRAEHLSARRELLQWWADRVEGLCGQRGS